MVVLSKTTLVVAGFSAAAAALPHSKPRLGFTLPQVAQPAKSINLPAMYAHALAKYGSEVPPHVKAAAASGQVTTNPTADDEEYITKVTVGQGVLNLDFDTGSSDLWVFSSELPAAQSKGHNLYKPSSNATLLSGDSWSISYGDGSSASGNVYRDYVAVGSISTTKQAVEAAKKVSSEFVQDTSTDGLLGLAFSTLNTVTPTKQTTFFDTVKSQLDQPLFAANLKHKAPGTYDFGFIDSSKYTGKITYTNVDNSQGFWGFTASGYTVGTGSAVSSSIAGIADTGTTLLLLPTAVVKAYYKDVKGATNSASAGGWVFSCSATLPDFTVNIGGYDAVVPGSYINFSPVSAGSSQCFGGIQDNGSIGMSIFGDVFLKSQYVVFNSAGPKLGFAPQS